MKGSWIPRTFLFDVEKYDLIAKYCNFVKLWYNYCDLLGKFMKFKTIFKILIILIILFVINGCKEKDAVYNLTQDGNFLVYNTNEELLNKTYFPSGTQLIIKVREDKIEEGYMIDKVFINSVANEPTHQYHITVDRNIDLRVTFKEIPSGEVRISISGRGIIIEPASPDNVYKIGTTVTLKPLKYNKFNYLYINDEKIIINDFSYELVVNEPTRILVESGSLEKTHAKVEIISPSDRKVYIANPQVDNYYLIGSDIIVKAPHNYHFEGSILVNNRTINLTGDTLSLVVEPSMVITFYDSNIVINAFNINLLNKNLSIIGDPDHTLFDHGSSVFVKSIGNNGLEIIDKLTVNGEEIEVGAVSYELTVESNLEIDATFKEYSGGYEPIDLFTTDFYPLAPDETVLSQSLNGQMFLKNIDGVNKLIFQKASSIKARIDQGLQFRYVEFVIKYDVEDVKIYQNGFGFINRNETIYAGILNNFSIRLEITALVPDLENLNEFQRNSIIENSDQVGNLTYTLEKNGLDVTEKYLETQNGLKFNEGSVDQEYNLIIQSDEGITIIQPIKVIVGKNVYTTDDLTFDSTMILQNNLIVREAINLTEEVKIIGNYHTITFDTDAEDLISVNHGSIEIESLMLKSRQLNTSMIKTHNSQVTLNNVVIENTKFGLHLINSDLNSQNSKFQNILESNILLVNDNQITADIELSSVFENNIFQKTNNASIIIVDLSKFVVLEENDDPLVIEVLNRVQKIVIRNNKFNNVKTDEEISEEVLAYLQSIDSNFVSRDPLRYNLTFLLDGGEIYLEYFPLLEITINEDPQCSFVK
ncbi:MAG: hypothetical protein ACOX5X_03635 [Acholeplasmataceae bacterium]